MPVGDIYKVRFLCLSTSQTSMNVTHWSSTAETGLGALPSLIAQTMSTTFNAAYKALMAAAAQFRGVGVQRIFPGQAGVESTDVSQIGIGTAGTPPMAPQVCGLISFLSPFAGKHNRGRLYVPFPSSTDGGTTDAPVATYLTRLDTLRGLFLQPLTVGSGGNTTTLALGIYNRVTHAITTVTGSKSNGFWKTQRRRAVGAKGDTIPF